MTRRGRLLVPVVAVAILAAGAILWVRLASSPGRPVAPTSPPAHGTVSLVGQRAPDFTLPILSPVGSATGGASGPAAGALARSTGERLSLHSLRGRPVVLNFWASWCVPCRAETPLLVRLHKVYGPRGVVFVGVDTQDEAADARSFIGQYHVDYTVVVSADDRLIKAYGIFGLPTTIFLDRDGLVLDREVGGFIGPDGEHALTVRLDRLFRSTP